MNLKDKIAVVTGGATGIGAEIVRKLSEQQAVIVMNYNSSAAQSEALANELNDQGGHVECRRANVAAFAEAQKLIDYTVEKYGRIDILVNNAGITADGLILRMSEDDFDKVIEVNLKGTWNTAKHAARYMSKNRGGKIVNIASVVALVGNAGQTNYCASKAGVIGLTKALARELAKRGVNVNAVAPGFIKTKMTDALNEAVSAQIIATIPMERIGTARDVANLVAFLCSDEADYITGQVINVDGGMVMN